MTKRFSHVFVALILNHFLMSFVTSQVSESINFPTKGESCNVVQVNCGGAEQGRPQNGDQESSRNPGPPGKAGQIGPKGSKGDVGSRGHKGSKGESVNADVLEMLSTNSCQELNERFGVDKTGFYLMRIDGSETPAYRYCDFHVYGGDFSCQRMVERGLHVDKGQYRFQRSGTDQIVNVECQNNYITCHEMSLLTGETKSGHYNMRDGESNFQVFCNFTSGSAVTEVWHDSMNEIHIPQKCSPNGCYSRVPQYKIDFSDMKKIIDASASCKQYIKYRCQGSVLLYNGSPYGWWVSSGGEKMNYWGGATSRRDRYCACGETGSCLNSGDKCNCDSNSDSRITQDEVYISPTNQSSLFVR